ncbi:MAG TPA: hypothetical protein VGJ70_17585 [Solirubrobacteraceae bacterium]|jgi:uncharacterized membrane protein YeaQ/YmgE (transglycosylase-associated protein family)
MDIVWWAIAGLVIGALARFVMPRKGGTAVAAVLGAVGAVGGGVGAKLAGFYEPGGPGPVAAWLLAILGAFMLVGGFVTMAGSSDAD